MTGILKEANATGWRKNLLFGIGTLSLVMGIVGIFLPIWPTTCFLLLATGCYSRSSERFYQWLVNNRWFGRYLADYNSGLGVPKKIKVASVGSAWLSIGYVVLFVVSVVWLKMLLLILAFAITYHILYLPSQKRSTGKAYGHGSGTH